MTTKANDLITIIVAIYNTSKWLDRCICSILEQTYENLEIILVNDGSTDDSGEICRKYENIDCRILTIDKINGGLTSARKAGFKIAKGKYIAFIDSDDYLESTYVEELYNNIIENNSDISICNYYLEKNDTKIEKKMICEKKCYNKAEYISSLVLPSIYQLPNDKTKIPNFLWLRLFRKKIITDECFVSEREVYTEDLFFNIEIYKDCKKISVVDRCLYNYCINPSSLTHQYRTNKYEMEKKRIQKVQDVFRKYKIVDSSRILLANIRLIWECTENATRLEKYSLYKSEMKKLYNDRNLRKIPMNKVVSKVSIGEKISYYFFQYKCYLVAYCFKRLMKIKGDK